MTLLLQLKKITAGQACGCHCRRVAVTAMWERAREGEWSPSELGQEVRDGDAEGQCWGGHQLPSPCQSQCHMP